MQRTKIQTTKLQTTKLQTTGIQTTGIQKIQRTRRLIRQGVFAVAGLWLVLPAAAVQLATDARTAIPKDLQQLIVVDYRAMQNSAAAMDLKGRVLPPEIKQMEEALKTSGLNENHDVDSLAFASFRTGSSDIVKTVGVAQGQFPVQDILANFRKQKLKPLIVRTTNKMYPMGRSGLMVVFVNQTTMVFGASDAVKAALDARDGLTQSLLNNNTMMDMMKSVDSEPLWSILDQKGTQTMMKSVMGEAAQLADYESVKKRLLSSEYTMNFQNGVKFNLDVLTPDTFTAASMASILKAAALYTKMSGSATEKSAIDNTQIDSSAGKLQVKFSASDSQFASLLQSPLFQNVVR